MDNSTLSNGSAISQRDISVSSGLADSESSPMSPNVPSAIGLHQNGRYRKHQQNPDKNRSQMAQVTNNDSLTVPTKDLYIKLINNIFIDRSRLIV